MAGDTVHGVSYEDHFFQGGGSLPRLRHLPGTAKLPGFLSSCEGCPSGSHHEGCSDLGFTGIKLGCCVPLPPSVDAIEATETAAQQKPTSHIPHSWGDCRSVLPAAGQPWWCLDPPGPRPWLFCILGQGWGLPLYSDLGHPLLIAVGKEGTKLQVENFQQHQLESGHLPHLLPSQHSWQITGGEYHWAWKHVASKRPDTGPCSVAVGRGSQFPWTSRAN